MRHIFFSQSCLVIAFISIAILKEIWDNSPLILHFYIYYIYNLYRVEYYKGVNFMKNKVQEMHSFQNTFLKNLFLLIF